MAVTHGGGDEKLEDEFQQTIRCIGGKERVYLVGDVGKTEDTQCRPNLFKTFIEEMFGSCGEIVATASGVNKTSNDSRQNTEDHQADTLNDVAEVEGIVLSSQDSCTTVAGSGPACKGEVPRVIRTCRNATGAVRLIDCALVIFIFKQEYVSNSCNHVLIKEIMKDIRARTKHSPLSIAVIGLVHSKDETSRETQSVEVLERLLCTVFRKHSSESIWTGLFIPDSMENMLAIKKHLIKAVHSSLSQGNVRRANNHFWSLRCLIWWRQRRQPRYQHGNNITTCAMETVEGIPLKTRLDGQQGDFTNGLCSSGN
ncbi:uncharacterized protein LOC134451415 isoform X1 [Engraulis encrasicolus]|uniref:uncharacterized protein LOC134451415 isoform X1 n=1 Tax=Engraulis encrasicolus TaxID=184585 RepID=UPI002FCE7143